MLGAFGESREPTLSAVATAMVVRLGTIENALGIIAKAALNWPQTGGPANTYAQPPAAGGNPAPSTGGPANTYAQPPAAGGNPAYSTGAQEKTYQQPPAGGGTYWPPEGEHLVRFEKHVSDLIEKHVGGLSAGQKDLTTRCDRLSATVDKHGEHLARFEKQVGELRTEQKELAGHLRGQSDTVQKYDERIKRLEKK